MPKTRADIHTRITDEIVAAIEAGASDWTMPWHHDGSSIARPMNILSKRPYRGVNILALWIAAQAKGYGSGLWGTYRQWAERGAQVRKGEKATSIVFWKQIRGRAESADDTAGEMEEGDRPRVVARGYAVFNRAQVDGFEAPETPRLSETARIEHAESFFAALGIPIEWGADAAFYRVDEDRIHMPDFGRFTDVVAAYGTLFHEAGHATGAAHRLDRDLSTRFSRQAVAMEEMVAELTASFVLADLGLAHHPRPDHAAYIASWLRALKKDTRAIFTAASKAQAAADWMHARQPHDEETLS